MLQGKVGHSPTSPGPEARAAGSAVGKRSLVEQTDDGHAVPPISSAARVEPAAHAALVAPAAPARGLPRLQLKAAADHGGSADAHGDADDAHAHAHAEIQAHIQTFRSATDHWVAQIDAAGSQAAHTVQTAADEQHHAIAAHAAQHSAAIRSHFAGQRAAATSAIARHREQLASGVARETQHVHGHATQQASAVAQDSAAKQAQIHQAGATHSAEVTQSGATQTGRVHETLGEQAAAMGQRGAAAAGSYGGGEKGHAQGVAAQKVAGKGQAAVQQPAPAIAGDVGQGAAHAAQKVTTTSTQVSSKLAARLPRTQQRIHGVAQKAGTGFQQLQQHGTTQLNATHGKVMAGFARKESEALSGVDRQSRSVTAALTQASARHHQEIHATTQAATGKLRAESNSLTRAAAGAHDAKAVGGALDQARGVLTGNVGRLTGKLQTGASGFHARAAQGGNTARQHISQTASTAQGQASQITAQTDAASQHMTTQALTRATQGGSQATQGIDQETTQARTHHQQIAQASTAKFQLASTQTTARLVSTVDTATTQNQAHIVGQVDPGMSSAASKVGADADKSLLDKVVDFFKAAWDWVSSVADVVAGIAINAFEWAAGALLQTISDGLGGALDPLLDMVDSDSFQSGRDFGDQVMAYVVGAAMIIGGIAMIGGGAAISVPEFVGTLGFGTPVIIVQDGVLVIGGVAVIGDGIMMMAKANKQSGKERGSDIPSWAKGETKGPDETPAQAADRVMRKRYPDGNYPKGPGSEYNKIKKFFERAR